LVFLYSQGRPTGDSVVRMLQTLKHAFRANRPLDATAFVIADRDYALGDQLTAERVRYRDAPFAQAQTWRIWDRTEIENYLLKPEAIERAVVIAAEEAPPLFRPQPQSIIDLVEQIVVEAYEPLRLRLINAFGEYSKVERLGWEPATVTQRAEAQLAIIWASQERYAWCDAKEAVLPKLRERIREQFQVQLSDSSIITSMTVEEIPPDLIETIEALAQFVEDG